MAAPKFDSNTWYQLWVGDGKQSFLSTVAYADSGTKGAVFFNWTDTSSKTQQWQIFQLNSTSWVLRTAEAGPSVYMAAALSNDEITEGKTRPMMARGDIADASAFWTFDSWGDGTYIITNAANGTGYHLNRKDNALMAMSPNISAPQNGQRWQYKSISNIDDKKYSTIDLKGATIATGSTSSATATVSTASGSSPSTAPPSSSSGEITASSSGGLSAGAKAGIGAAIGAIALIALIVLGLFLWRKRKQKREPYTQRHELPPYESYNGHTQEKYEMFQEGSHGHAVEAPRNERPAELMGDTIALEQPKVSNAERKMGTAERNPAI